MVKRKPEDDGSQPFTKSARSSNSAGAHHDADSPLAQQAPFFATQSSRSSDTSRRESANAVANRDARQRKYREGLAVLNYQLYQVATRALQSPISGEGGYCHLTSVYTQEAARLRRLYCKIYGDVAVCGSGECGQLGCGQGMSEARSPRIVAGLRGKRAGAVAAGGIHTLVLTDNGGVYSFGCNDEGALGGEIVDDGFLPCEVKGFVPSAFGPRSKGPASRVTSFEERKRQVGEATIVQIIAGETTSLALSEDGDVYMWGSYRDSEGRKFRHMPPRDDDRRPTGRKDMATLEEDEPKDWYYPPRGNQDWPLHLCLEKKAIDISAGDGWAVALLDDGSIVTWGIGTHGEMGREVPKLNKKTPNDLIVSEFLTPKPPLWNGLPGKKQVIGISCGAYHLLALTRENQDSSVYSCGLNQYGQLGLGDSETRYKLTKVRNATIMLRRQNACHVRETQLAFQIDYFEGRSIGKVEGGYHFSSFVNNSGKELYCCGRSDSGQLGISLEQPEYGAFETTPIRVPLVYDVDKSKISDPKGNCVIESDIDEEKQPAIEQISCGSTHVMVLTKCGDVYSWGFGESGACGQGRCDNDILRPKKLKTKLENAQGAKYGVKFVSAGGQHSVVVVATESIEQ